MVMFRDALIGVWCLSWQPGSGDVSLEPLTAVLRYNRQRPQGLPHQGKGVLAIFGHQGTDTIALLDASNGDLHSANPAQVCTSFKLARARGWLPAWYPVTMESAERWAWMMQTA